MNIYLNIDHGFRSQESKRWSFAHPNQVFNFDELHLRCGMREEIRGIGLIFLKENLKIEISNILKNL